MKRIARMEHVKVGLSTKEKAILFGHKVLYRCALPGMALGEIIGRSSSGDSEIAMGILASKA